jgi:hypothetical protein
VFPQTKLLYFIAMQTYKELNTVVCNLRYNGWNCLGIFLPSAKANFEGWYLANFYCFVSMLPFTGILYSSCHKGLLWTNLSIRLYFTNNSWHNQSSTHKDVFETINLKKTSWSHSEDQYGSLELFIWQCRHDIEQLPKFRPKRPPNLTDIDFGALF